MASDGARPATSRQADERMDALTRGTLDGAQLLMKIVAMLIVLIALVHLANASLALLPAPRRAPHPAARARLALRPARLDRRRAVGGGAGRRRAPRHEDHPERVRGLPRPRAAASRGDPSARSRLLMTYALCGFANFGSLGILIGGMGTMVPGAARRDRRAGDEVDRRRDACHLPHRGGRGAGDLSGVNESHMAASSPPKQPGFGVANARRSWSYGCALRLDWDRLDGLLGHAEPFAAF